MKKKISTLITVAIIIIMLDACGLKPPSSGPITGTYTITRVKQNGPGDATVWLEGVGRPVHIPSDTLAPGKRITLVLIHRKA